MTDRIPPSRTGPHMRDMTDEERMRYEAALAAVAALERMEHLDDDEPEDPGPHLTLLK